MIITKHFKTEEFIVSKQYPDLVEGMFITQTDHIKLFYLCTTILEPARDLLGAIRINSGKRTFELNKKIKGSTNSDHLFMGLSCAVDFTSVNLTWGLVYRLWTIIKGRIGELIIYTDGKDKPINWVHVSLPTQVHYNEAYISLNKKLSLYPWT